MTMKVNGRVIEFTDVHNFAGTTEVSSSMDGPRTTTTSDSGSSDPSGLSGYALTVYKKLIAKGMKPAVASAFAKRAAAMQAKKTGAVS